MLYLYILNIFIKLRLLILYIIHNVRHILLCICLHRDYFNEVLVYILLDFFSCAWLCNKMMWYLFVVVMENNQ